MLCEDTGTLSACLVVGWHLGPHGDEEPEPDLLWCLVDGTSHGHRLRKFLLRYNCGDGSNCDHVGRCLVL